MGNSGAPDARDPVDDYRRGIDVYLQSLPRLLQAEQTSREQYDPQRIEQQLALLDTYDPNYLRIREQMGDSVSRNLTSGYDLPDDFERELEQDYRGAGAARGNVLGNASASGEAIYKGSRAIDFYNRNLANAGTYLGMPSPATPDRSAAYTVGGLSAGATGASLGQMAFSNQLAAHNAQGNPWATALGGAASGAAAGSAFGPWGAVIGGVAGGAAGYFSDARLKENVEYTGELSKDGIPIARFSYVNDAFRYEGVIAQDVEKVRPDAVHEIETPFGTLRKWVDYNTLGVQMKRV